MNKLCITIFMQIKRLKSYHMLIYIKEKFTSNKIEFVVS